MNVRRIEAFLASTKLTLWVLVLIGLLALLGTLIPQGQPAAFYASAYGARAEIITSLGLNDVYHSIGFLTLIGLFALNLLACTFRRWPAFWRLMRQRPEPLDDAALKALPLHHQWTATGDPDALGDAARKALEEMGFRPVIIKARSGRTTLFAEKGKISRTGFFAVHVAILCILLGAVIAGFGFKGSMMLLEGESSNQVVIGKEKTLTLDFSIRCDDFEATTYAGTQRPRDYKSNLTILEDGREVLSRVIEVNHPLTHRGVTIYQASYGSVPDTTALFLGVAPADSSREPQRLKVRLNEPVELADGTRFVVTRFVSDFVMDEDRRVTSRSAALRNPAVQLALLRGNEPVLEQWLFARHAAFHASQPDPWRFVFMGVSGNDYTGLQLTRAPGLWLVWLGCGLFVVGLLIVFFTSHRRLWVVIERGDSGHLLTLAGASNRPAAFKAQMTPPGRGARETGPAQAEEIQIESFPRRPWEREDTNG